MADPVRIIPLGGLGEVGKNMTVIEGDGGCLVIDAGLAFPRDEHLGVDLVLPDISYLADRGRPVDAVVLTHAHEDHVGGLPYLLREVDVPRILGTKLTLGLVQSKLAEHKLTDRTELVEVRPEDGPVEEGPFRLELVRMAHSIPDNAGVVVEVGGQRIFHTSDYKVDHTPIDGFKTDVGRLAELGNLGVDLMLGDSTNAERPGYTGSERLVGEAFRQIIPLRKGRILVASFASNVHRMQQAADVALESGRKVCVVGRSMRKNLNIARVARLHGGARRRAREARRAGQLPAGQGAHPLHRQPGRADVRAHADRVSRPSHGQRRARRHRDHLREGGPGNELRVHDTINELARAGAEVLHHEIAPVHVSGHGNSEEIRTVIGLVRPKAVMPVHGEYRMLAAQARMAQDAGVPAKSIVLAENGSVVELSASGVRLADRVDSGVMFVDGLAVGDISDVALRDRRRLSEDGVVIVVATLSSSNGKRDGHARADRARLRRGR